VPEDQLDRNKLKVLLRNWDALPTDDGGSEPQFTQAVTVLKYVEGLEIRADGYGDKGSTPGYGSVLYLELDNNELVLRVWADINQEDPTHTIRLGTARESERRPDAGSDDGPVLPG